MAPNPLSTDPVWLSGIGGAKSQYAHQDDERQYHHGRHRHPTECFNAFAYAPKDEHEVERETLVITRQAT